MRRTKPKIKETIYRKNLTNWHNGEYDFKTYYPNDRVDNARYRENDYIDGCAAYVWRMLAFYTGINNHMPVLADCDIPVRLDEPEEYRKQLKNELDSLVDCILAKMPNNELHGLNSWARALHGQNLPGYSGILS